MNSQKFFLIMAIILFFSSVTFVVFQLIYPSERKQDLAKVDKIDEQSFYDSVSRPVFVPENLRWANVLDEAPWVSRDAGETFLFRDKMWLMGGLSGNNRAGPDNRVRYHEVPHFNDIWHTTDGLYWIQAATSSAWAPRRSMSVVFFNEKLWMIGGWSPTTGYTSDIWNSRDGVNWVQVVKNAEWGAREGQVVKVFQDRIWLFGGVNYDRREVKNDAWYSFDGMSWVSAGEMDWRPRWDHSIAIFNGKLFLTGGMNLTGEVFDGLWVSQNGRHWVLAKANPPWAARQGHAMHVYRDKLWIIGRFNDQISGGTNDIWFSGDGDVWEKTVMDPQWIGREDFFSAVFRDKIWVFGGMDVNFEWRNDVWASYFR